MKENFYQRVYDVVKKIPYGRVTTYGIIAKYIGEPRAARMVGMALNKCFTEPEFIPAHRVVNRIGLLTGKNHFGNSDTMKKMLESEGVEIVNDMVLNFEKLIWRPN